MRAMIRSCGFLVSILVLLLMVTSKPAEPQIFKDVLKDVTDKIPSLDSFMEEKPAISTSLKDAVTEVPFLDDFNPKDMSLMTWLPRGDGGSFKLTHAGVFKFKSQSYCLHAGTYAPTEGDGYLYAPIAGPRAMIIKAILERTWNHPEIEQHNIQTLIWAILAHSKISDMRDQNLSLAMSILTKDEIMDLNGGALGMIPDELMGRAMDKLSPAMRPIFEAESKLRGLMTVPGTTYGEFERVAVLTGVPVRGKDSRDIPGGRWSYHPDGFFIRYFPHSYPTTDIEISVPGAFTIIRDDKGRIISVNDNHSNLFEMTYDDSINPSKASGDSNVTAYAFKSIRYKYKITNHAEHGLYQTKEWTDKGWTSVGSPNGKGKFDNASGRFNDSKKRYESIDNHKKELEKLIDNAVKARGKNAKKGSDLHKTDAIDIASLCLAMRDIGGAANNDFMRISSVEFLQRAWQLSACLASGASPVGSVASSGDTGIYQEKPALIASLYGEDKYLSDIPSPSFYLAGLSSSEILAMNLGEGDGGGGGGGDDGGASFDPCQGVACPGNTGSQRIKPSGREQDDPNKDDEPCKNALEALKNALRWAAAYSDPDVLANSKDPADYNKNVEKKAKENFKNETGGEGQVSSGVGVDSDCQLYVGDKVVTFDEFRKWLEDAECGAPPEVIEALVQHERKHMEQCYKDDNFGTDKDTKENLSKCEIEAYCTEAQLIMDYMNRDCGGVPPDLQQKFAELCGG